VLERIIRILCAIIPREREDGSLSARRRREDFGWHKPGE